MKLPMRLVAIACVIAAATPSFANDAHHPDGAAATEAGNAATMKQLQEAQDQLAAASTPESRQAAMMQSMQAMKQAMAHMQMMDRGACKPGKRSARSRTDQHKMMDHMMQMMDQQSSMRQMMK